MTDHNYSGQRQDGSIILLPGEQADLLFTGADKLAVERAHDGKTIPYRALNRLYRMATEVGSSLAAHYLETGANDGWSLDVERTDSGQVLAYTELCGIMARHEGVYEKPPHSTAVAAIIARGLGITREADGR